MHTTTPLQLMIRLLLAAALGAVIGIEREYRQKAAGLRTNILIALGSALFTTISLEMVPAGVDPSRVAAQIVTGVGFLGGGAILRSGRSIHGMTTAATIWVNAAVGMAVGAGFFAMAAVATAITLAALALLLPVEAYLERRAASAPGVPRRRATDPPYERDDP